MKKDFITRTMIIIVEKYNSNNNPKFIDYQTFQKELETTISIINKKLI